MAQTLTLHVVDGDYGLVSLDIECIQSILYAKLSQVPVEVKLQDSIKSCALHNAPSLKNGKVALEELSEIVAHFKNTHGSLDKDLSSKQQGECLALTNLVQMKMKPVADFIYWVDQRNCDEFTSRWFMKALPLPFNYSYVKRKRQEACELIETLYPFDSDLEVIKEFINQSAAQCLATLSTRLGKLKYFYGDNPTSIDIIVYSYVAPFVKLPFPSNEIPSVLSMWPNLTQLITRIDSKYFPELTKETKYLRDDENTKHNDDEVSYMAIFILVVSASSLVIGFALKRGLLNFYKSGN